MSAAVRNKFGKEPLKFMSATGKDIHIPLLDGSKASLSGDGTAKTLKPKFHQQAILRGAVPIGDSSGFASGDSVQTEPEGEKRSAVLRQVIQSMTAQAAESDQARANLFTSDGKPIAAEVEKLVGFKVSAAERDEAWDAYAAETPDAVATVK